MKPTIFGFLRDRQQDKPTAYCYECERPQYSEDTLYLLNGERLCGECIERKYRADYVDILTTYEKAAIMGADCEMAVE